MPYGIQKPYLFYELSNTYFSQLRNKIDKAVGYCLLICRVSSTDQIYHRAAKGPIKQTTEPILGTPILGTN